MCNGIVQSNESVENHMKDPAMLETPIADHLIFHNDNPQATDRSRDNMRSIGDGKVFSNRYVTVDSNNHYSSPLMDKNGDINVFSKESQKSEDEPLPHSPLKFNRRTPDLDKIADFFRNNRTPKQKKLLAQFESSVNEDTPVSQRLDNSPLKSKINKKTSGAEYMQKISNADERPSLEVTEADIECKIGTSRYDRSEGSQKDSESTNRLKFLDHGTQSQEQIQTQEIQRIRSFQDVDEIPSINENNEHKTIPSDEETPDTSLDGELHDGDHNPSGSRVNDTTDGDISVQWIFRSGKNNQGNSNKSTQIIPGTETQDGDLHDEIQKTQPVLTPANETQTEVVASLYAQEALMDPENNELESPTQIVRSPEHSIVENTQDGPFGQNGFGMERIAEVPDTSPPSHSRDVIEIGSSPSSPRIDVSSIPRKNSEDGRAGQERVLLQLSSKPEPFPNSDPDQGREKKANKSTTVVFSETELTQDLPEVEDQVSQEKKKDQEYSKKFTDGSFEESQEITKNTWKRGKRNRPTIIQEEEEEEEETEKDKEEDGGWEEKGIGSKIEFRTHPKKKIHRGDIYMNQDGHLRTPERNSQVDKMEQTPEILDFENRSQTGGWLRKSEEDFPQEIKKREEDFLSKNDIKFEDAVWCQYDLNYCFYPGRLISYDEKADGCWVIFETGQSLTKNDDIYYLDIRVGDTVNWQGKAHKVIALECRTQDHNVIRCIRGYDTVYLKKRNVSGKLAKKISVPLSSINLDLNEWAKRPKVILEEGSHTRAKAFKFLRHPIRGRNNITTNLSPRKARLDSGKVSRPTYKEESDEESNDSIVSIQKNGISELSSKLEVPGVKRKLLTSKSKGIFDDCLFILSGLNEEKYDLSEVISSLGGTIVESGFPNLFNFETLINRHLQVEEYALKLEWKPGVDFSNFRFACLLTTKHLRSLKYLETLALGWPTLHWKFVEECVSSGEFCMANIHQYLLPSGESFRLKTPKEDRAGVIKSNNIFQFYLHLLQNALLKDQIGHNCTILSKYLVLIFGHSELDRFVRFILGCLGINRTFQIPSKIGNSVVIQNLDLLKNFTNNILQELRGSDTNVIIYINGDNELSNEILDANKKRIFNEFIDQGQPSPNLHVESKEWLIQTLINGHPGFN